MYMQQFPYRQIAYNTNQVIGEGGFGKAYCATSHDGSLICLKCEKELSSEKSGSSTEKEFSILRHLHHPHLVQVFGSFRVLSFPIDAESLFEQ